MSEPDQRATKPSLEERYRVLLDIGRSLTETLSPEDLYQAIFRETSRIVEATGFYISLYDRVSDLATIVFYADQGDEQRVEITYKGSDSDVIRHARGSLVSDRLQGLSVLVLGEEDSEVTRSAISAPLRYKGEVVGAISAQSYRFQAYDEADLEILQGIADIAAVAMENARHVTELNRRRLEAERIEEIGRALTGFLDSQEVLKKVASAVLELLEVDGASVWFLESGLVTTAASVGSLSLPVGGEVRIAAPLTHQLVEERRPVILVDIPGAAKLSGEEKAFLQAQSALVVPLIIEERVAGALVACTGETRHFSDEDGKLLQRLASQGSVALDNARLHASLQALSLTDPLTGLPNRRHLQMHLEREIAAARRGRDLSVVLFDLDNFKAYNDTLGHVAGDQALRVLGRILAEESRAMNLVSRYGGDEFFSVLSDTPRIGADNHALRVLARVAQEPSLSRHGLSMSYGVAEYSTSMKYPEELIEAADRDMYRAKNEKADIDPFLITE
ncbi:MAG: sensor domain-containing diguanylate cyclase [Gemmatimonadota bacterium]